MRQGVLLLGGAAALLAFGAAAVAMRDALAADACLDAGGCWDHAARACAGTQERCRP